MYNFLSNPCHTERCMCPAVLKEMQNAEVSEFAQSLHTNKHTVKTKYVYGHRKNAL